MDQPLSGSLAVDQAFRGDVHQAVDGLNALSTLGALSRTDRLNLRLLQADLQAISSDRGRAPHHDGPFRVAIVSLLFNWPSTAGGIVHTAELAEFLSRADYDVCHFFAVYEPWAMGHVAADLPYASHALIFTDNSWNRPTIVSAFRESVGKFTPDCVIVTDSWNTKGMLAEAVSEFPYFLRLAAMECLCPLNNVRLIPGPNGSPQQCGKSQLATRDDCVHCVARNTHAAGPLHVAERQLAGFSGATYHKQLLKAFCEAEGVFAVNPLIAALCEPFARHVHVIPSGFDPARFATLQPRPVGTKPFRLLFAGLVSEYMKGFPVLFEACCELWRRRQDFELHVTASESESPFQAPFLQFRGWQDQATLPHVMADCDVVVVPTIAQEALGRTAVEAMAAARPVIASRLGGLRHIRA